jgi:hypothetical protein
VVAVVTAASAVQSHCSDGIAKVAVKRLLHIPMQIQSGMNDVNKKDNDKNNDSSQDDANRHPPLQS